MSQRTPLEIELSKCTRCGFEGDAEAFFRLDRDNRPRTMSASIPADKGRRRSVCIGCELTARNDPTPEARALRKARNSIAHHAEKWSMTPTIFARRFGWEPTRMVHDVLHVLENTCVYCWFPYAEMGHGLDDVTVDVVDPEKDPYYSTNVQWCCRTCNSEKATLAPDIWARRLIEWRRWQAWHDRIEKDPRHGLPLFEASLPLNGRTGRG